MRKTEHVDDDEWKTTRIGRDGSEVQMVQMAFKRVFPHLPKRQVLALFKDFPSPIPTPNFFIISRGFTEASRHHRSSQTIRENEDSSLFTNFSFLFLRKIYQYKQFQTDVYFG